jgi:hypothetical protein
VAEKKPNLASRRALETKAREIAAIFLAAGIRPSDPGTKPNLVSREAAFRAGDRLALWDEVFESGGRVEAEWAREALVAYAKQILTSLRSRKGKGRQALAVAEQRQIWDDFCVFESVNEWRGERWKPKTAKSKRFSWRQAFARVAREHNLSLEATRAAYRRAEKKNKEGYYVSELFLHTIRISEAYPGGYESA